MCFDRHVARARQRGSTGACAVLAALVVLAFAPAVAPAAQKVMTGSGGLSAVYIDDDLGCQVRAAGEATLSFFGGTEPGDCGTFLALTEEQGPEGLKKEGSERLFGPKPSADAAPPKGRYEPVSQTLEVIPGPPATEQVVTKVRVLEPGANSLPEAVAEIEEQDVFVEGVPVYGSRIKLVNLSFEPLKGTLYHAGDCNLSNAEGYGVKDFPTAGSVACTLTPNNTPFSRFMAFSPSENTGLIQAPHAMEGNFTNVWANVNEAGSQFPDTVDPTLQDNGMGISWPFELKGNDLAPENEGTVVLTTYVSPPPVCPSGPPKVAITSDQGQIGYQLNEPGSISVTASGQNLTSNPTAPHEPIPTSTLGTFTITRTATDECGTTSASFTYTVLPPPALGKSVNVEPVSGTVLVALPAGAHASRLSATASLSKGLVFVPLAQARQIPVGSVLETTSGVAHITTATSHKGAFQEGDFGAGIFKLLQSRRQKGLTQLDVIDNHAASRKYCATIGKRASAAKLSSKALGRLTGSAHGKFTTRGRYSAATVRGTIWGVTDQCNGTLTRVTRGVVKVRDFVRRKTVTVSTGRQYLAHAPGH
jgi:hypothetical protein